MPMPTYRNTNYSPIYALLEIALICGMYLVGLVFRPTMNNLAGSVALREFKTSFQNVQHPTDTERLSLQAILVEFAGSEQGCDFFVSEVRRYGGSQEVTLTAYTVQAVSGNSLQVVFLEGEQIPAEVSNSLPEPLNDLAGWELVHEAEQQPLYMVYVIIIDYEADLSLDCW